MILICTDILQSNYLELTVPTGLPLNLRDATVRGVDWQPAANQLYLPLVESQTAGTACSNEKTKFMGKNNGGHEQPWRSLCRPLCCAELLASWNREICLSLVTAVPFLQAVYGSSVKQTWWDS